MPNICYIVGTAGSGKTMLTSSLQRYLITRGASLTTINLDPAVQHVPYQADIDIREFINFEQLVDEYQLGPNGAMIAAADLIADYIHEIQEQITDLGESSEVVLIDTPGQIELFAYRTASLKIIQSFPADTSTLAFLFDSALVSNISGFLSINLLATSVQIRLNLPMIHVLTKSDLIKAHQIETILSWREDPYVAIEELHGMNREFSFGIGQIVETLSDIPILPISSLTGDGMELLAAHLSRTFTAGDDWSI